MEFQDKNNLFGFFLVQKCRPDNNPYNSEILINSQNNSQFLKNINESITILPLTNNSDVPQKNNIEIIVEMTDLPVQVSLSTCAGNETGLAYTIKHKSMGAFQ